MITIYRSDLKSENFPGNEYHAALLESWMDGKDFVEVADDFFKPMRERKAESYNPAIKKLRHKRRTYPGGREYIEDYLERKRDNNLDDGASKK